MNIVEARIEARGRIIFIEDLGVRVYPGSPVWVSVPQARASACLAQLTRLGKVTVSFRKRCKVSKDPPRRPIAIAGALSRPRKAGLQKPFGKPGQDIQKAAQQAGMTPEEVANLVQAAAAAAAQQAAAAVVGQINAARDISDVEARLQRTIEKALQAQPRGSTNTSSGPEEPVYIPTGIVRDDLDSEVQVQAAASKSGELDDAAKALKALRQRKTREAMSGKKT
jgi:hypothetical protein